MIKTGQYISMSGLIYLFLGYSDKRKKRGIIADRYGNKTEVFIENIKEI